MYKVVEIKNKYQIELYFSILGAFSGYRAHYHANEKNSIACVVISQVLVTRLS